jgi:hypothetical protein
LLNVENNSKNNNHHPIQCKPNYNPTVFLLGRVSVDLIRCPATIGDPAANTVKLQGQLLNNAATAK